MSELDLDLVKKGMSEPREGVRDEGVVHIGLGQKYAVEMAACGWAEENTTEIETLVESLGSHVAEQAEARVVSKGTTSNEGSSRASAKALIGKVRLGASIVLSKTKVPNVTKESFEAGHTLGQSTPKIAMYLEKVPPAVKAIDDQLMPYFGGEKASEMIAAARSNLDVAQATQEVTVSSLPRETQEIYEAMGRLLRQIEEMNKVGKITFYGQGDIMGQFNKDVLNRARKSRKKDPPPPSTGTP